MLLLIIFLPFIGFIIGFLLGKWIGKSTPYLLTLLTVFSCIFSFFLLFSIILNDVTYILNLNSWIYSSSLFVDWVFCLDPLTCVMLVVVTFISSLVHLYSIEYMAFDPHIYRFMSYLSFFTFFMLVLITGNNFVQLFVGWEGVGLASYLLINFWFTRIQANKSAIKAMLVNRVGDFFLLIALFCIYIAYDSLDYEIVFTLIPYSLGSEILVLMTPVTHNSQLNVVDIICLFLFLGAMGKSAQLTLHTWLPDAMEGPTPVSALIHAATMVTAGVFLIIRCSFLFEYSTILLQVMTVIGATTAFFAASTALFQNDVKKVIAYSTCSQLGYMVLACGLSSYDASIFHLSNHAFFKALLFLGAGSVIHALSDEQDMRRMGGLKILLPFSYASISIGSLALIGFPFLAGFYSKDCVLEIAASDFTFLGNYAYFFGTLSALFTSFYSTRMLCLIFLSNVNGSKNIILNARESSLKTIIPLLLLSILSVTIGFISKELFIGFGSDFWGFSIFILPKNLKLLDIEFIDLFYKLLPFFVTILGIVFSLIFYIFEPTFYHDTIKRTLIFKIVYTFLNKKWFIDRMYNELIVKRILTLFSYELSYKSLERGVFENLGPSGILVLLTHIFRRLKYLQTNFIIYSLFLLVLGILTFIFFFYLFSITTTWDEDTGIFAIGILMLISNSRFK